MSWTDTDLVQAYMERFAVSRERACEWQDAHVHLFGREVGPGDLTLRQLAEVRAVAEGWRDQ